MTIYTGGTGYESVINGSGESTVGASENSLPTWFYLTLPYDLNQELISKAKPEDVTKVTIDGETQQVVDLSDYLTFTYDDGEDANDRTWTLERYDKGGTSMAYSKYIYRINPAEVTNADDTTEEVPIRLLFTDEDGQQTISDDFTITTNNLYETYSMTIYAGDLQQDWVQADVTIDGEKYDVAVGSDTLTIRGVTDNNTTTTTIVKHDETTDTINEVSVQLKDADTNFYINEASWKLKIQTPLSCW